MHQIVYGSRAVARLDEGALMALCERSLERNRSAGVTGLLLYDGRRFLQALEGPEPEVRRIMARIEADSRHSDISYMADRPVPDRQFGDWSMDMKKVQSGCCSQDFLSRVKQDLDMVKDMDLRAAFIGFALLSGEAAPGYRCSAG